MDPPNKKVGWQLVDALPDHELGSDDCSWAYDGSYEEKIHAGSVENYGKLWNVGNVIGVFLDLVDKTISELSKLPFDPWGWKGRQGEADEQCFRCCEMAVFDWAARFRGVSVLLFDPWGLQEDTVDSVATPC